MELFYRFSRLIMRTDRIAQREVEYGYNKDGEYLQNVQIRTNTG